MNTTIKITMSRNGLAFFIPRVAWMGGSSPRRWGKLSSMERQLVKAYYIEQHDMWVKFWAEELPREQSRIFWRRARGDAHATMRDLKRSMST